jgi:hypothetical protein
MKLKYFEQRGWEKDWIKTAQEIVEEEFTKYAAPRRSEVCSSQFDIISN